MNVIMTENDKRNKNNKNNIGNHISKITIKNIK